MSADELGSVSDRLSYCQLRALDIRNNEGISGCLSVLFKNIFPTLQILTLGHSNFFGLNWDDMESLALASELGKLPNLRHLFIYSNNQGNIHLFTGRTKWNQLLTLRIGGCNVLGLEPEYLASLQSVDLRGSILVRDLTIKRRWPHLQTIKSDNESLLSAVVDGLKKGLLPALKTVRGPRSISPYFGFNLHKQTLLIFGTKT